MRCVDCRMYALLTDRPTDGHSQLQRCFVAPKKIWKENHFFSRCQKKIKNTRFFLAKMLYRPHKNISFLFIFHLQLQLHFTFLTFLRHVICGTADYEVQQIITPQRWAFLRGESQKQTETEKVYDQEDTHLQIRKNLEVRHNCATVGVGRTQNTKQVYYAN